VEGQKHIRNIKNQNAKYCNYL